MCLTVRGFTSIIGMYQKYQNAAGPQNLIDVYVGLRHSVCWDFFEFYLESDLLLYLSYSVSVLHCISLILYMFHSQTSMTASFPFH